MRRLPRASWAQLRALVDGGFVARCGALTPLTVRGEPVASPRARPGDAGDAASALFAHALERLWAALLGLPVLDLRAMADYVGGACDVAEGVCTSGGLKPGDLAKAIRPPSGCALRECGGADGGAERARTCCPSARAQRDPQGVPYWWSEGGPG